MTSSAGTTSPNYDYESRITSINYPGGSTVTYTYNGLDTRVGKNEGTSQTFQRDGTGVTAPVLSDGLSHFTPGVSQHASGATTFTHADRLGSYDVQTDATQSVTATQTFDAFGMLVFSTGTPVGPFGFVGKEGYQSDASGLMLLGHRYYDGSTGRFLTRDPAKDGRNWYAYVDSSPTRATDPTGNSVWGEVWDTVKGFGKVIGGVVTIVTSRRLFWAGYKLATR